MGGSRRRIEGGRPEGKKYGYCIRTIPMQYVKHVFFILIKQLKCKESRMVKHIPPASPHTHTPHKLHSGHCENTCCKSSTCSSSSSKMWQ